MGISAFKNAKKFDINKNKKNLNLFGIKIEENSYNGCGKIFLNITKN